MTFTSPQLAVLVTGTVLSTASLVFGVAGILELAVILGPIGCCTTWVWHNSLVLLLWLPTLGVAAWQLAVGWQKAAAFVALGAIFITLHMLLLLAYWVRRTMRRQAAMELPTQQLLTEAHRMMMTGAVDVSSGLPALVPPPAAASTAADGPPSQFALQVGRSDGVTGLTVFIPAEAEEAALAAVAARHYQQRMAAGAGSSTAGTAGLPPSGPSARQHTRTPSTGGVAPHTPGAGRQSSSGGVPLVRQNSAGSNARESLNGARSSRQAGLEDGRSSRQSAGLPAATSARTTPSRGVVQVLPEVVSRWGLGGSSRQHRYRALEGAVLSPSGSLRTSTDAPFVEGMQPSSSLRGRQSQSAGVTPGGVPQAGAGKPGRSDAQQAVLRPPVILEGSNPLHHEASLRHMLPRMSFDAPLQPAASGGSGTAGQQHPRDAGTPVPLPVVSPLAAPSPASHGVPAASPPLTPQRSHNSFVETHHSRRGSDVPATPQPHSSHALGVLSGILNALGGGGAGVEAETSGSGGADEVLHSRLSLFGASGEANTSHHSSALVVEPSHMASGGSGPQGTGTGQSGSAGSLPTVPLTPIQTGLVSPGPSARGSLERLSEKRSGPGGSAATGSGKGQGSRGGGGGGVGGARRSHVRTHSLPLAPSLTMALLDEQDSSGEVSSASPSPTSGQLA